MCVRERGYFSLFVLRDELYALLNSDHHYDSVSFLPSLFCPFSLFCSGSNTVHMKHKLVSVPHMIYNQVAPQALALEVNIFLIRDLEEETDWVVTALEFAEDSMTHL